MPAPAGNQNARRPQIWRAAIERALERRIPRDQKMKAIDELADRLIDMGYEGDMVALKEIGDRLEGKCVQRISGDSEGEPLRVVVLAQGFPSAEVQG
jgi:hypothetical protein